MMRPKRRMADQQPLAIEQHGLDVNAAMRHHVRCSLLRRPCDLIAQHQICRRRRARTSSSSSPTGCPDIRRRFAGLTWCTGWRSRRSGSFCKWLSGQVEITVGRFSCAGLGDEESDGEEEGEERGAANSWPGDHRLDRGELSCAGRCFGRSADPLDGMAERRDLQDLRQPRHDAARNHLGRAEVGEDNFRSMLAPRPFSGSGGDGEFTAVQHGLVA